MDDDFRDFDRVMAVDLYGVIVGTQQAARRMETGGSIINTTSIAGISPGIGLTTYRAAKAGVIHFSRCAAIELAERGIRVNVIAPGNISTAINAAFDTASIVSRLQPLQRLGHPHATWRTPPSTSRANGRRRSPVRCSRSTGARRPGHRRARLATSWRRPDAAR